MLTLDQLRSLELATTNQEWLTGLPVAEQPYHYEVLDSFQIAIARLVKEGVLTRQAAASINKLAALDLRETVDARQAETLQDEPMTMQQYLSELAAEERN